MAGVAVMTVAVMIPAVPAGAVMAGPVEVPPGNASSDQPAVDRNSVARTRETGGTFEAKYRQIYSLLERDPALIARIKKVAARYGIDPVHIVGAIVGEHTYNVDAVDTAQAYYVKAMSYLGTPIRFQYKGEAVSDFVARPEFERCKSERNDFDLWDCRDEVWKASFSGRTVDGVAFPKDRFSRVFFQPLYAGQTFGLGQLSPVAALSVADIVSKRSGRPPVDMDHAAALYSAIMDPNTSLDYIAALIKVSIDSYRQIAGFDISRNPGITATLYNVGDVRDRAYVLKAANARSGGVVYPQVNYMGWFVNTKADDLERLLK
ncbi:DUF1402 family protein [Pseudoxanthobacter sp.]|uniref:DUF1402 family protein n=1 Tax=Pseudoxanthobacter sp. TaxID=1925742 RepID=UPI002FE3812A